MATALAGARTVGTDSAAANEKRHASEYAVWRFVKWWRKRESTRVRTAKRANLRPLLGF